MIQLEMGLNITALIEIGVLMFYTIKYGFD